MAVADLRGRIPPDPGASHRTPVVADDSEARIVASFRRFRESVVRLVEQVNDQLLPPADPADQALRDLRMVRSAFGKWSAELLVALHATPAAGFEDLRRTLRGISARVLSLKLKELEETGLVRREILDTHPPRVRYSLTERGWTIAWLAQPIFLYMRVTQPSPSPSSPLERIHRSIAGEASSVPAMPSPPATAGHPPGGLLPRPARRRTSRS